VSDWKPPHERTVHIGPHRVTVEFSLVNASRLEAWWEWISDDVVGASLSWGTRGTDAVAAIYFEVHPPRWLVNRSPRKALRNDPEGTQRWLDLVRADRERTSA